MGDPKIFEVKLDKLTYGGDAMGRLPDGKAVFVPFGLPDETVRLEVTSEKRGFARAKLLEVLQPSPLRIQAECPHFSVCGGCHYQHLSYPDQLVAKKQIVLDQLERIAKINHPPLQDVIASPLIKNYRNTVQFHVDGQGKLGYLKAGSSQVEAIRECLLPEVELMELWQRLEFEPGSGIERVELRQASNNDLMLILESEDFRQLPEMEVDFPLSVTHLSPAGTIVLAGDDFIVMEMNDRLFKVSAGSFFQVNRLQAEAMVNHVLNLIPAKKMQHIVDVYCGVGLFSAFLADRAEQLTCIESSETACEDFAVNLDEFEHVSLYMGAAEEVLPQLNIQADVILVDPPRAGIEPQAMDSILAMQPQMLIYVSCDLATLARDLRKLLDGGYELVDVTPFDMFPQTYHVETVALLKSLKVEELP